MSGVMFPLNFCASFKAAIINIFFALTAGQTTMCNVKDVASGEKEG